MTDRIKIKLFKADTPEALVEEINNFGDMKEIVATQPQFVEGKWVAFVYYKS